MYRFTCTYTYTCIYIYIRMVHTIHFFFILQIFIYDIFSVEPHVQYVYDNDI